MSDSPSTLIIPVENQVRELDAKILLSCIAAEKGFPVILGSRAYTHFQAASVPRGVYLAKSMRSLSTLMFQILRKLGHEIVAWEEEALVHPPADNYFSLRLSATTIKLVSHIFAWGQENFDLLADYPQLPKKLPIHISGNPRGDMLRPELRAYFEPTVHDLQRKHGDFILINTNFTDVNPFIPAVGMFLPADKPIEARKFGQLGKGLSREFAEGLYHHKQATLDSFMALIPQLAESFPELNIIIRPHPSENFAIYDALAEKYKRITVTNEGNVLPWLLAMKVMVHNGCTTGLEAFALKVPAISYLPTFDEFYDYEYQGLPTRLSHECFDIKELTQTIQAVLAGELHAAAGAEREKLMDYYVAARQGPLASERIVDILVEHGYLEKQPPATATFTFMQAWCYTHAKAMLTRLYMHRPGPNRKAYHDHRFPVLSVAQIEERVGRFAQLLQRFDNIQVQAHSEHLFRISSKDPASAVHNEAF